ncbi:MAG TPA: hypothetical protein VN626_11595 [Clostridia bacterium]|nr:hypothetical protein [Clostridia bacterium]
MQYVMGNIGVMGMILILTTLGDSVGIYMSSIYFVDQCVLWTICENLSYPIEEQRSLNLASIKKVLTIPTMIAFFIAIVMIALDWHPDNLIMDVLTDVGKSSKAIAMIFIGGTLATLNIKRLTYMNGIFSIIGFKMILMPLLVFGITGLFGNFLNPLARMALTLSRRCPVYSLCLFSRETTAPTTSMPRWLFLPQPRLVWSPSRWYLT